METRRLVYTAPTTEATAALFHFIKKKKKEKEKEAAALFKMDGDGAAPSPGHGLVLSMPRVPPLISPTIQAGLSSEITKSRL